ncbi:unnamed protein product [Toxocara canis]|uniref:CRAL_TRIO_N domain-containing protein n=1 Tax=Toxocara canis TaxID=6265 RepID=A0A183V1J5_TOXCA|nr:unnamed protein product [Toxocara canis]
MRVALSPLMLPLVAPSSSSLLLNTPDQVHLSNTCQKETTPIHSSTSCSRAGMSESGTECNGNKTDLLEAIVFSSLYGYQAIPIRIKILLHRALSGIDDDKADALIQRAGWTKEDFQRGFIDENMCFYHIGSVTKILPLISGGFPGAADHGTDRYHRLPIFCDRASE